MPKDWKKPKLTEGEKRKAASDAKKTIARNKKARHDYLIEDTGSRSCPVGYRSESSADGARVADRLVG